PRYLYVQEFNYCAAARVITSASTAQVFSISASVSVGCTKNINDVSPNSRATGKRCSGRQPVPSKAFSKYTSEHDPEKHGTPWALISPRMRSRFQSGLS